MKKVFNNERGISLIEVVASLLLVSIILISFFGLFIQSKKTSVASESIVDATYVAQQEMEEMYGIISDGIISNTDDSWLNTDKLFFPNSSKTFTYDVADPNCKKEAGCKKFLLTLPEDNPEHWIQLKKRHGNLVDIIVNVPKKNSSTPVIMESIFRWGN